MKLSSKREQKKPKPLFPEQVKSFLIVSLLKVVQHLRSHNQGYTILGFFQEKEAKLLKPNASLRARGWLSFFLLVFSSPSFLGIAYVAMADPRTRVFNDHDIQVILETKLLGDPFVPGHLIDVRVNQGIVQLAGFLPNLRGKRRAATVAKTIKGVQSVVNLIKVKRGLLTDEALHMDIMKVLREDPVTKTHDLTVRVQDGKATLVGEVPSWTAKLLTIKIASGTAGLLEIDDRLTVIEGVARTDRELAAEIRARWTMDVWIYDPPIGLQVEGGRVRLSGTVRSVAEKDRVYHQAWIPGVTSVDDRDLTVTWPTKQGIPGPRPPLQPSDDAIAKAINLALQYDPRVSSFTLQATVAKGHVVLRGTVDNLKAKKAAERDARQTVGVQGVQNLLKVRPSLEMSDDQIRNHIQNAMSQGSNLVQADLTITVNQGRVWLHGRVDSVYQKILTEDLISKVSGVVDIKNRLQVDAHWTWQPDWKIDKNIQHELWWSPYVDSDHISVTVKEGRATLRGTVNSWAELRVAIQNAFEGGAKSVRNLLTVGGHPSEGSELLPDFMYDLPFFSLPEDENFS